VYVEGSRFDEKRGRREVEPQRSISFFSLFKHFYDFSIAYLHFSNSIVLNFVKRDY
jgi:hypothetical protein